jgi:hypothetical protein
MTSRGAGRPLCLGAIVALLALAATLTRGQEAPAPAPGASGGTDSGVTSTRGALPGGAPEIAGYKDKIVFVLDRSGSMALGDRFATALDVIDQLLHELPKDTKFDIYLATETVHSLFKNDWYRPSADMRKQIRTRIAEAGGLDYGGFTDIVGAMKAVLEKRHPEAVYLLSDGVATVNEIETEKIIGAVVKASLAIKAPVHTIAIGVGQDVAEDATQAVAVMKGIAESTGGIYREVKSEARSRGRAFLLWPPWAPLPAEDQARIHLRDPRGKEFRQRVFGAKNGLPDVIVEIEDPALQFGSVAFEYADPKLVVRTFLANGKLFFETRPVALKRMGDRFVSNVTVKIVNILDESPPDEITSGGSLPVKCPSGGSVDFVYKRGAREFRESAVSQNPGQ